MPTTPRRSFLQNSLWLTALAGVPGLPALAAGPTSRGFLDAVRAGDREAVARMLDRDPGLLHVRDGSGRTAFATALLAGHPGVARLLRERGYAPDLHESALALDWERFDALAEASPGLVNRDHPVGGTAMFAAARGGAARQMWRVYRYGGDPDARPRGASGLTPVLGALEHPDLGTAELTAASLLSNGADPDAADGLGRTPLHAAAARGAADLVETLLRLGARPDVRDDAGHTPADLARRQGHEAVVALLGRRFPRPGRSTRSAFDVEGEPYRAPDLSAFDVVRRESVVGASHFDFDRVKEAVAQHPLLAHSVATTTERAVEACAHTGRKPIVRYLLERGAPYSLPTAVMLGDRARAARWLEEDPARIHERGAHAFALLWYASIGAQDGSIDGIETAGFLMERGAGIDDQHFMGTTVLHQAALRGQRDLVAFLLERGADIDRVSRTFGGKTALELAVDREQAATAELLRSRGARLR